MLYRNFAFPAFLTLALGQSYPDKETPSNDNKACQSMCSNGAFAVQMSDSSTVTFDCAEPNPKNAQWYTGTCTDSRGNSYGISGICQQSGGYPGVSCCLYNMGDDDAANLSKNWATQCEYVSSEDGSANITGPISYDTATAACPRAV